MWVLFSPVATINISSQCCTFQYLISLLQVATRWTLDLPVPMYHLRQNCAAPSIIFFFFQNSLRADWDYLWEWTLINGLVLITDALTSPRVSTANCQSKQTGAQPCFSHVEETQADARILRSAWRSRFVRVFVSSQSGAHAHTHTPTAATPPLSCVTAFVIVGQARFFFFFYSCCEPLAQSLTGTSMTP